jgi:hypothetical protein
MDIKRRALRQELLGLWSMKRRLDQNGWKAKNNRKKDWVLGILLRILI